MKHENKNVIVTGGGRGIGKAIALNFAEEGANVVVNDINFANAQKVSRKIKNKGQKALPVEADVSIREQVKNMMKSVTEKFGTPDILVNNAGIIKLNKFSNVTEEEWDKVINVNLKGTFNCCQIVGSAMLKKREGCIINISSISGLVPSTGGGSYSASKAGVAMLTNQLAVEWGKYNIRVNGICPGFIRTPMEKHVYEDKEVENFRKKLIPLNRIGTPEDVAKVASFLASDDAEYINGELISVDGGAKHITEHIFPRKKEDILS